MFLQIQRPNPNSQQGSDETGIQIRCGLIWVGFFRDQVLNQLVSSKGFTVRYCPWFYKTRIPRFRCQEKNLKCPIEPWDCVASFHYLLRTQWQEQHWVLGLCWVI